MTDTAKHCPHEHTHKDLKKGERCKVCNCPSKADFEEMFAGIFREKLAEPEQP